MLRALAESISSGLYGCGSCSLAGPFSGPGPSQAPLLSVSILWPQAPLLSVSSIWLQALCSLSPVCGFSSAFIIVISFTHLLLAVLGLRCFRGFSLVAESGDCSLAVVCGPLTAVAPLVAEHRLQSVQASVAAAHGLSSCGSWALEHRLSRGHRLICSTACGIFPDQVSNL